MLEENIENAITKLEMAAQQLHTCTEAQICPHAAVLIQSSQLIKETLDILRGMEVSNEIDSLSEDDGTSQ